MKTQIIDGKELCKLNNEMFKKDVERIQEKINMQPEFVIINASNDAGNARYIKNKIKEGESVGLKVTVVKFEEDCTDEDILNVIDSCNTFRIPVILQLPIFNHLNKDMLVDSIDYKVDADGFCKEWIGEVNLGNNNCISPATPKGVMNLLEHFDVDVKGKVALVIGKSNHVGKPLASMLMNKDATVLVANKDTKDLVSLVRMADIIISCVGKVNLINPEDIKEDAVVIGVGFTYVEGKQILDFDVDKIVELGKAKIVSNRINCTGKMTVNALISNVIQLYKMNFHVE